MPWDDDIARQLQERLRAGGQPPAPPQDAPAPLPQDVPAAPPPPQDPYSPDRAIEVGGVPYYVDAMGNVSVDSGGVRRRAPQGFQPPPEVQRAVAWYGTPGQAFTGDDGNRYALHNGVPSIYDQRIGQHLPLNEDEYTQMPAPLRELYGQQYGQQASQAFEPFLQRHSGDFAVSPADLKAAEDDILRFNRLPLTQPQEAYNNTPHTPQELQQMQQQAAAELQAATASGDQQRIAAAQQRAAQLQQIAVMPGAEGGYNLYTPTPFEGQSLLQSVTPDNAKQGAAAYQWPQYAPQLRAAAEMQARRTQEEDYMGKYGNAVYNDDARRLIGDYAQNIAKNYRAAQLRGETPVGDDPMQLAAAMNEAWQKGDFESVKGVLGKMQAALSDGYSSVYDQLRPDLVAMRHTNPVGYIPQQQPKQWKVDSHITNDPNQKAKNAAAQPKYEDFTLHDMLGQEKEAQRAIGETEIMGNSDPGKMETTARMWDGEIYAHPDAKMQSPRFNGQQHPGEISRNDFTKMAIERSLAADPQMRDGFKKALVQGVMQYAKLAEEGAFTQGGKTKSVDVPGYFATMKELFGSHTPAGDLTPTQMRQMQAANQLPAAGELTYQEPDVKTTDASGMPVTTPGAMKTVKLWGEQDVRQQVQNVYDLNEASDPLGPVAGQLGKLTAPAQKEAVAKRNLLMQQQDGALAKSLMNINATRVRSGGDGKNYVPLSLDSRLKNVAGIISNTASAHLMPVMQRVIEENRGYFEQNAVKGRGGKVFDTKQVLDAIARAGITNAMLEMMTQAYAKK